MSSRRKFILNCSALAATAALAPATALALRPRLRDVGLENISAALLAEQVNTWFVARDNAGAAVAVQLAALEPAKASSSEVASADGAPLERFSLLFAGDVSKPLAQNTYFFEHAGIGRFAMFIVPIGRPDSSRCFYEAVFSRPAPEPVHLAHIRVVGRSR